jgi:hypothetical protein
LSKERAAKPRRHEIINDRNKTFVFRAFVARSCGEVLVPVRLIDPRSEVTSTAGVPAPRLATLAGATLAFMDISKPGGSIFLDRLETLLARDHGVARIARTMKPTFTKRAPEAVIDQLRVADAVVLALAD